MSGQTPSEKSSVRYMVVEVHSYGPRIQVWRGRDEKSAIRHAHDLNERETRRLGPHRTEERRSIRYIVEEVQ